MDGIGPDRKVFLLCDSWYPKGCVASLVDGFYDLNIMCNVRIDTVMFDFLPICTEKRGRPRKYGESLSSENLELTSPEIGALKIGVRPILTRLWNGRVI